MITPDELKNLIELKREGPTLDYKQDLNLEQETQKAEFVKDVLALANSGYPSYIVTGMKEIIKDDSKTWEPISVSKHCSQVQLNQILQYRTDPPISIEYAEIEQNGIKHGIVKIFGENPPYLVMLKDKFSNLQKGTVFIRNIDMNEGARRADLDQMYSKVDLRLSHIVKERKVADDSTEIEVEFLLTNIGRIAATFVRVTCQFSNILRIVRRTGRWQDISYFRNNVPAIQMDEDVVHLDEVLHVDGVILQIAKDVKQVNSLVRLSAADMRPKKGDYVITLE
jgi:hypothetical protein